MTNVGQAALTAPAVRARRGRALLAWYASEGRDLPWRRTRDPYRILVSEVMLQQTQSGRVVPFYERFVARFPTVGDLAAAPLRDVLAAWNGLGYNARARRLHAAAGRISDAGWPSSVAGLERLPGVGPYTARAVAAFAFDLDVVPIDTNVRRVVSRWHGAPLAGEALAKAAEHDAGALPAATWSQAVMDLGAVLCRARAPCCNVCPVEPWCAGPETYVAPPAQPRFEGSRRQLRGAIVRELIEGPRSLDHLASVTDFGAAATREALERLADDGLVEKAGSAYRLPS